MTFRPYDQLTSSGLSDSRANDTGVQIDKGTPVRINSAGTLDFVNVAVEDEALNATGVASASIPNGSSGEFLSSGKIEDITTTADFGDLLFIDKTGSLTNTKPTLGENGFVSGDFVVAVGVVAKNQSNPLLKDLIINIDIQGQL